MGNNLTDHNVWSQTVTVRYVQPTNIRFAVPEHHVPARAQPR